MDALVCGVQRRLTVIQERCNATEAMCKEGLAQLEDRLSNSKTDTASEHAAMKLEIGELSKRIDMMPSLQGLALASIECSGGECVKEDATTDTKAIPKAASNIARIVEHGKEGAATDAKARSEAVTCQGDHSIRFLGDPGGGA